MKALPVAGGEGGRHGGGYWGVKGEMGEVEEVGEGGNQTATHLGMLKEVRHSYLLNTTPHIKD